MPGTDDSVQVGFSGGPLPVSVCVEFFESLDALFEKYETRGSLFDPAGERLLNRYCVVLALFDEVFRTGRLQDSPLVRTPVKSAEGLLDLVSEDWVDDLSAQSHLAFHTFKTRFDDGANCNPHFEGSCDVGGADGDLLLGGSIIEFKSTINPTAIKRFWWDQLLGYILLDYEDQLEMEKVGIYFARQGVLVEWALGDFLQSLSGSDKEPELPQIRRAFKQAAQRTK